MLLKVLMDKITCSQLYRKKASSVNHRSHFECRAVSGTTLHGWPEHRHTHTFVHVKKIKYKRTVNIVRLHGFSFMFKLQVVSNVFSLSLSTISELDFRYIITVSNGIHISSIGKGGSEDRRLSVEILA